MANRVVTEGTALSAGERANGTIEPLLTDSARRPLDPSAAERLRRRTIARRDSWFRRTLALADVLAVAVVLVAGALVFGEDGLAPGIVAALLLIILVMKTVGLYDRDEHLLHKTTLDEVPALFQVATLSAVLLWLLGDLLVVGDLGRRQVLGMWLLLFVLLIVGRSLARQLAKHVTPTERCLLLGDATSAAVFRRKLALSGSVGAELVGWLPIERVANGNGVAATVSVPDGLDRVLTDQQVHRIILAPGRMDSDDLMHSVHLLRELHVHVSVLPATPAIPGTGVETDQLHGLTLLGMRSHEFGRSSRLLKRSFDVCVTSLQLLLLAPLLAAIAIAIKLDSPGPVLFRQRRIGRHGEPFEMLKFRSMTRDAEEHREELFELNEAEGLFKISDDPRITTVGRLLRRWSLDELPQLVNVLRGEMSLVGPRPLIPEEDSLVEGHYRRRLDLAPGMTGLWQALGASRIPLQEMVRLDYQYVTRWSLWSDVRIILRTVPYIFGGKGR